MEKKSVQSEIRLEHTSRNGNTYYKWEFMGWGWEPDFTSEGYHNIYQKGTWTYATNRNGEQWRFSIEGVLV